MLFGFGFLGSGLLLCLVFAVNKLKSLEKLREAVISFNASKLPFLRLTGKKLAAALTVLAILLLLLTVASVFINRSPEAPLSKQAEQTKPAPGKAIMNENKDAVINQGETGSGCGNGICEPVSGETKGSCPKDCSGGD